MIKSLFDEEETKKEDSKPSASILSAVPEEESEKEEPADTGASDAAPEDRPDPNGGTEAPPDSNEPSDEGSPGERDYGDLEKEIDRIEFELENAPGSEAPEPGAEKKSLDEDAATANDPQDRGLDEAKAVESVATPVPVENKGFVPDSTAETIRKSGLAYSAAIALFGSVVFMLILGWFADLLLGVRPWGTVIGISIGAIIGFMQFFRITSRIISPKNNEFEKVSLRSQGALPDDDKEREPTAESSNGADSSAESSVDQGTDSEPSESETPAQNDPPKSENRAAGESGSNG